MSGTKIAMPQPNSFQSGALSFMSCTSGRESSPLDENDSHQTAEFKTETKKKRFHPLRNLRRMFRRKTRRSSISTESYQSAAPDNPEITPTNLEQRSCSTSRLQEENLTQNLFRNSRLNPGLSLSHDSIFTPDRADSGLSSSDLENSSLSITVLTPPSKECPMKSQSSCSESSLLSIESSEVELSPVRTGKTSELDVGTTAYTLSHSAARHKMAVKPRRNHGAPRSRRRTLTTKSPLPITLEVSEEGPTGRNSPPALQSPGVLPKCDRQVHEAVDSSAKEVEDRGNGRAEEEAEAKEEEAASQRSESFFGRFLSRRSDKKKKVQQESGGATEESGEEKGNSVKKVSKGVVEGGGKGAVGRKPPNRRQRVEPVEIPSTSCLVTCDVEKDKKISGSISPPKSYWPCQVTSRSMSPPKVVWPESATPSSAPDRTKANVSPTSQSTENAKDWKNPNFVKELTVSVSSFAREKSGKREEEEEEETVPKMRREHSTGSVEEDVGSSSAGCIGGKTCRLSPMSFDAIHDGYENVQIIERVKQEVMNSSEARAAGPFGRMESGTEAEVVVVVKKAKPLVSEKPKDLKRAGMAESVKVSPGGMRSERGDGKGGEKALSKAKATLVERRKSELLLLTESEERELRGNKVKPVKKQQSFCELWMEKACSPQERENVTEKTDPAGEMVEEVVVLRKKAVASTGLEEQPELMKVFARRSLKVREGEKMLEEMQRSRDSDKENEVVESPKEERKKEKEKSLEREGEKKEGGGKEVDEVPGKEKGGEVKMGSATPVKPEIVFRKNVLHTYGRSLSENNGKTKEETESKRESVVLEEHRGNKMRSPMEKIFSVRLEKEKEGGGETEDEVETGFKRIQQRKAEWERRAQQGAK